LGNDGAWQLRIIVNTTHRTDTTMMNRSPRVLLPQLPYALQIGCSLSIQLNGQSGYRSGEALVIGALGGLQF